ncbi:MAG: hypothetical protein EBS09_03190 [Flavobacteriia bacterium]|jgi:hypothetical protein|nr:hypothetical protein [Flavobacteriia bacterium]
MTNGFLKKNKPTVNSKPSFRFVPWLIFFFSALISIPVFILLDLVVIAKCVGILTTVILAVMIRFWLHLLRHRNNPKQRIALNQNDTFEILRMMPCFGEFSVSEKKDLLHRVGITLSTMEISDPGSYAQGKISSRNLAIAIGITTCFETTLKDVNSSQTYHFVLSDKPGMLPTENGVLVNLEETLTKLKGVTKVEVLQFVNA